MSIPVRPIQFAPCSTCKGSATCQTCEGSGKSQPVTIPIASGAAVITYKCGDCRGTGDCHDCEGIGELEVAYDR